MRSLAHSESKVRHYPDENDRDQSGDDRDEGIGRKVLHRGL